MVVLDREDRADRPTAKFVNVRIAGFGVWTECVYIWPDYPEKVRCSSKMKHR